MHKGSFAYGLAPILWLLLGAPESLQHCLCRLEYSVPECEVVACLDCLGLRISSLSESTQHLQREVDTNYRLKPGMGPLMHSMKSVEFEDKSLGAVPSSKPQQCPRLWWLPRAKLVLIDLFWFLGVGGVLAFALWVASAIYWSR